MPATNCISGGTGVEWATAGVQMGVIPSAQRSRSSRIQQVLAAMSDLCVPYGRVCSAGRCWT
eukprot:2721155-Prymnesium_polylepis.1